MIGFAVVAVRRFIGPREVYRKAPRQMRMEFWILVLSGIALASVPVLARDEAVRPAELLPWWPFVLTVVLWVFSAGAVWGQFNSLRERILALESTAVRKDTLADKLDTLSAQIQGLRALIERTERDSRDARHHSDN